MITYRTIPKHGLTVLQRRWFLVIWQTINIGTAFSMENEAMRRRANV